MAGPAFFIFPTPLPFHYKPQINCNNPYKLPRSTRSITTLTHSAKHTKSLITTAYLSHHKTFTSTLFPSSLSYKPTIFLTLTDNPYLIFFLTIPHILHIPSAHTYSFSIHFLPYNLCSQKARLVIVAGPASHFPYLSHSTFSIQTVPLFTLTSHLKTYFTSTPNFTSSPLT